MNFMKLVHYIFITSYKILYNQWCQIQYCLATNYGHVCVGKLIPVLQ